MSVLFINPDWDGLVSKRGGRFNRKWPPLCLLNCASLLEREGIKSELIDLRAEKVTQAELAHRVEAAERVFITSSPIDRWQCPNLEMGDFIESVKSLRHGNLYIMGAHGTMFPEKLLRETGASAVIIGEPEMTVRDICMTDDLGRVSGLAFLRDGLFVRNDERPLMDLDALPVPAYHLLDISLYDYPLLGDSLALLETSRGCPFSCSYCYKAMFGWRGVRRKSLRNVIQDLEGVVSVTRARSLYFIDLEFTLDRKFVHELCDHMINERYDLRWCCQTRADTVDMDLLVKMKKAGCRLIHYGVETGSARVMESIKKNIRLSDIEAGISMTRKAGMETACFFMFGFPGETREDMEATVRFALRLNPTYASFHMATPYPGTELYKNVGVDEPFPEGPIAEHSLAVLTDRVHSAFRRFYLRPSYVLAHVLRGTPSIWRKQLKLFMEFIG